MKPKTEEYEVIFIGGPYSGTRLQGICGGVKVEGYFQNGKDEQGRLKMEFNPEKVAPEERTK